MSQAYSRKVFIKGILAAGAASQIPWLISCSANDAEKRVKREGLDRVQQLLEVLFPADDLGPGAVDFFADRYIQWVTDDPLRDQQDNDYLRNGFNKLDLISQEKYTKDFKDLSFQQQEEFVALMSTDQWGKSWLSRIISLVIESMFANPLYGSNPDGVGWSWLGFSPGQPQPKDPSLIYPNIINTIREN